MYPQFSPEQIKDIQEREAKGLEALKALDLTPSAIVSKQNIGNDVFADKVTPFLKDIRYSDKVSPLQKNDINPPESKEPVGA